MIEISNLTIDGQINPIAIGVSHPRFHWLVTADAAISKGSLAVYDGETILWTTAWEGDARSAVYAGPPLTSRQRLTWAVEVENENGDKAISETQTFGVPLLDATDWTAKWIESDRRGGPRTSAAIPTFRTSFNLDEVPETALTYTTALGTYRLIVNGQTVSVGELAPGWTDYRKRVRFQTSDIAEFLKVGDNVIEAELGDGWYVGNVEWRGREMYGTQPAFLGQFEIAETTIVTDESWTAYYGGRLQADLLMGEHLNATISPESGPVRIATPIVGDLVPQAEPKIEVTEVVSAKCVTRKNGWPAPDYVVDFGQNLVGRIRITVRNAGGKTIRLRHAEVLKPDGHIYIENLRSATQTDFFTVPQDADVFTFEPMFTFHGFRYLEIRGVPEDPDASDIQAVVLHSDYRPTGTFACSDALLNQLQQNIWWGWRGNSVDVPTDCPQRDERLGWTGDAQVFCRTAAYLADVETFFRKYVVDLMDAQKENGSIPAIAPNTDVVGGDGGPAWADVVVIVPWTIYRTYGNPQILEEAYDSMARYVQYLEDTAIDGIRSHPEWDGFKGFGDWLSINADTPNDLIGTAFFAHVAGLMAKIAAVLGKTNDVAKYEEVHARIKAAFQGRFVTPTGQITSRTQTAYLLALHFELLDPAHVETVVKDLVRNIRERGTKLSTGFVGSPYLNHVLTDHGQNDLAFDLLQQKEWPSWLYAVTQGATTIWERWDGWTHDKGFQDAGMNSFNHYAYGAIGDWMYQRIAGIDLDPEVPAYKKLRMRPLVGGGLTWAHGTLETRYGTVESRWELDGDAFHWTVEIPFGTTASVQIPTGFTAAEGESQTREITAGKHVITAVRAA
jgi:alpha-L-rhamnosidase